MKITVETLTQAAPLEKSWVAIYADLFKARLTLLVLVTTLIGFYVGWRGPVNYFLMFNVVFGTALLASGAAALNQLFEKQFDAKMRRTCDRPLPSGRLSPQTVSRVGWTLSLLGLTILAFAANWLTALLGTASLLTYVFLYTPLKRVTWMNTLVGAIPGALPPLMGWTAAQSHITAGGLALFAILAFWQLPHFMAIAWLYQEDYGRAGFKMLPLLDPDGSRTGRQAVINAAGVLAASLVPFVLGLAGVWYLSGAVVLGILFLASAWRFARDLNDLRARHLFYMSIIYLPALLGMMVLDKTQ